MCLVEGQRSGGCGEGTSRCGALTFVTSPSTEALSSSQTSIVASHAVSLVQVTAFFAHRLTKGDTGG